jgi:hypothetical protein
MVDGQVKKWVHGIRDLARVVRRYPQAAYAGLTRSLSMEWTYLQRVVPEVGDRFKPVEKALVEDFIPTLFDEPGDNAKLQAMRPLFALRVWCSQPAEDGGRIPWEFEESDQRNYPQLAEWY